MASACAQGPPDYPVSPSAAVVSHTCLYQAQRCVPLSPHPAAHTQRHIPIGGRAPASRLQQAGEGPSEVHRTLVVVDLVALGPLQCATAWTIIAPPDTTRSGYSSSLNCSRGLPATPVQCDCVSSVLTTCTPAAAARAARSGEIGSQGMWAHSSTPASSAS